MRLLKNREFLPITIANACKEVRALGVLEKFMSYGIDLAIFHDCPWPRVIHQTCKDVSVKILFNKLFY